MNRLSYIHEKEAQRVSLASWYITVPGISEDEKKKIEKSLHYNLKKSLMRFTIALFVLMMIWAFGFMMHFDPYESATGYELIGRKMSRPLCRKMGRRSRSRIRIKESM